jgi:hydroxypyruvate isomerase
VEISRRDLVKGDLASAASAGVAKGSYAQQKAPIERKGNIKQSVARWCYEKMSVDELALYGAEIGLKGVDLLDPPEFEIPLRYGLICTMGYAIADSLPQALNRLDQHAVIEAAFRKNIPLAAKFKVPNLITFSGTREGIADDKGARSAVVVLNRLKRIAEDYGITICMELLNSKLRHEDYMCDHTVWGVRVVEEVNSPRVKLLYDIYHMQIMEGNLISTIQANHQWIGHFHTGGVPGRHELDKQQEVQWDGVMQGIASTSFDGYVAHEFLPTDDPRKSLRDAVDLCDV